MPFKEMSGTRFGKLLVKERAPNLKDGTAAWVCVCDCGQERTIAGTKLRAGKHKSCGCSSPKFTAESLLTHGMSRTRVYRIWAGMNERCSSSAFGKSKRLYFDKGIIVCHRWKIFENFLQDMGIPPSGSSLERIDGDKNYEPINCKWATAQEQANNTSRNHLVEHMGKKQTLAEWAREIGVKPNTLTYRIKRGMPIHKALETQVFIVENKQQKT